jgi:cleavage and polyadenylation specificity factor subunit 1
VVQVFQNGLRLLDGAKMTQELLLESPQSENAGAEVASNVVVEAAIADPFVLLKMSDSSLQLVVGGKFVVARKYFLIFKIIYLHFVHVFV